MLSNSAFNALLKTIEEPPPYIIFMFATTELHKVPATIKSRCQQFNFRLVPLDTVKELLATVAADIGIKADEEALLWIAKESTGSVRDAYTLFDQVAAFSGDHITIEKIKEKLGIVGLDELNEFMSACAQGDAEGALSFVDESLTKGISVEQFTVSLAEYLRSLLLLKSGIERSTLLGYPKERYAAEVVKALSADKIERGLSLCLDTYRQIRYSVNPRFDLELTAARLAALPSFISQRELSDELGALKAALSGAPSEVPSATDQKKKIERPLTRTEAPQKGQSEPQAMERDPSPQAPQAPRVSQPLKETEAMPMPQTAPEAEREPAAKVASRSPQARPRRPKKTLRRSLRHMLRRGTFRI
jgi:DNA polymerase-3 subunit gamma/tau